MAAKNTPPPGATIVWRRDIDHERHAHRIRRFVQWYVAPLAAVLVIVAILVDPMSALGVLILFGGIGGLVFAWIWFTNRNDRANPTMWVADGRLHLNGSTSVEIAAVDRYAIRGMAESVSTSEGTARVQMTRVFFRLTDGSISRDFVWPNMPNAQHPALNDALWELFPGRSQAHEEMLAS